MDNNLNSRTAWVRRMIEADAWRSPWIDVGSDADMVIDIEIGDEPASDAN